MTKVKMFVFSEQMTVIENILIEISQLFCSLSKVWYFCPFSLIVLANPSDHVVCSLVLFLRMAKKVRKLVRF